MREVPRAVKAVTGRRGGGRGAGDRTKRGRELYGRRKKREWEEGEKKGKLRNIVQYFAIAKIQRGGSQQIQGGNQD